MCHLFAAPYCWIMHVDKSNLYKPFAQQSWLAVHRAFSGVARFAGDGALAAVRYSGPTHRWCDLRSFVSLGHYAIITQRDVGCDGADPPEAWTGKYMVGAGIDVLCFGVDVGVACWWRPGRCKRRSGRRCTLSMARARGVSYGGAAGSVVSAVGSGYAALRRRALAYISRRDCRRFLCDVAGPGRPGRSAVDAATCPRAFDRRRFGAAIGRHGRGRLRGSVAPVLGEFVGAANMFGDAARGPVAQRFGTAATETLEAQEFAGSLAYGWHAVHDEPTLPRTPGRFAKSFPLKFRMRMADLFDERYILVTAAEYTQHISRLPWTWGPRGDRLA